MSEVRYMKLYSSDDHYYVTMELPILVPTTENTKTWKRGSNWSPISLFNESKMNPHQSLCAFQKFKT